MENVSTDALILTTGCGKLPPGWKNPLPQRVQKASLGRKLIGSSPPKPSVERQKHSRLFPCTKLKLAEMDKAEHVFETYLHSYGLWRLHYCL